MTDNPVVGPLTPDNANRASHFILVAYSPKSVEHRELGEPLAGMAPLASERLDISKLQPADMVFLVSEKANPGEGPIGTLKGKPVWVWHTGMFVGDGRWIVGDHFAGKVIEVPLRDYLVEHANTYSGAFILRMSEGPKPQRCRKHPPLRPPRA